MRIFESSLENILMYLLLAAITVFVFLVENKDIKCPTPNSSKEECKEGGGMAFSYTKPEHSDTCHQLISKIEKAAGAEQASIKWRRSLIMAITVMVVMWFLVGTPGGLPDWKILYLSIIVSYVILFANYNYYSYHVYGMAETWAKDAIRDLERKGCINE